MSYERHKLAWKCRRGLLELDLVFQKVLPSLEEREMQPMNELLDMPDNDLWDVVAGRSDAYPSHLSEIVTRLRSA